MRKRETVLHVLGAASVQYGTFEDNLVALAAECSAGGRTAIYVYPRIPASSRFIEDVEAAGGGIVVTPGTDGTGIAGARAIRRVIARPLPAAVHAHFGRPGYLAVAAARSLGVRKVFLTKHHESWPALTPNHARVLHGVSALSDRLVCVSERVRAEALAAGVPASKLAVLPFGLDASKYSPDAADARDVKSELGLEAETPLVLCVSHLREPKGVDVLVDAWSRVAAYFPSAALAIAGDGVLRPALERQAAGSPSGEAIRFLGVRQDVPRLLAACDAFVCPSLSEAGGLNIIEALCAAAPVVSTRVGLVAERVDDALYVPVPCGEPGPLADGVARLLADPPAARRLGAGARARVAASFPIARAAASLASLYHAADPSGGEEAIA